MSTEAPRPFWRRLLAWVLPEADRENMVGDLEEEFRRRVSDRGRPAADRWFRREVLAFVAVRLRRPWSGPPGKATRSPPPSWRPASTGLLRDIRHGVRGLVRSPGYAAVALLTLALALGGTTALFTVVDGVLLRPLPYPEPDRLVAIHETLGDGSWWSSAPVNAQGWRDRSTRLQGVAWSQLREVSLTDRNQPERAVAAAVSANYLDVLGVRPALGRTFESGEDKLGAPAIVVLTYETWRDRFGADPSLVGTPLDVDGIPHTVVGVLPEGRGPNFLGDVDLLVPRVFTEIDVRSSGRVLQSVARLADGVTMAQASDELSALAVRLDDEITDDGHGWGVRLVPLREQWVGNARGTLALLLAAVGFVLLVACANLSNLMLARGNTRAREMALRTSLGASRLGLIRLVLAESVVLAALGGAAGYALARWGVRTILSLDPGAVPRLREIAMDGRVLAFVLVVTLASALLFGLLPALRASASGLRSVLASGRGSAGATRHDRHLRAALVGLETTLVVALLVGAGLMVRSVEALTGVDPGFRLEDRLAVELNLPAARYPDSAAQRRFIDQLRERVQAIPGIVASGTVSVLPLTGSPGWTSYHIVESLPEPTPGQEPIGGIEIVSPGYFEVMGIPLEEGRTFQAMDRADGEPVVVVDHGMTELYWTDRRPLNDRLRIAVSGHMASQPRRVVGVVGDVRYGLDAVSRPRAYLPVGQSSFAPAPLTLVVRTAPGLGTSVSDALRQSVWSLDGTLPVERIRPLSVVASASLARARLQTVLLGIFAAVALALGAVGIYGVVGYAVTRRTAEVGVRLALGATPGSVVAGVVGEGLAPVAVGLALGLVIAYALARTLGALVYGVAPGDPVTFVAVPFVLGVVAVTAALLPGLRAARLDPVRALRVE